MKKVEEHHLEQIRKEICKSFFIFLFAFCAFIYLLGFSVHDTYLHWITMFMVIISKIILIVVVPYCGANFINNVINLIFTLKKEIKEDDMSKDEKS